MDSELGTLVESLVAAADPAGGWGYAPGQPGHLEPTCFALLALQPLRPQYQAHFDAGLAMLERNRLEDGSYRLQRGRPQAIWPTSLVALTRARLEGIEAPGLEQTRVRLEGTHGRLVEQDPEVDDMVDIDLTRIGWPWAINTFSWVEPTAWASLALRALGRGGEPRAREGLAMLLDRAFDEGGLNYGNRRVLGRMTEPIPTPTAVTLLALQGHAHPRIDAARQYLLKVAEQSEDVEHLAWAVLAFSTTPEDATAAATEGLRQRLRQALRQQHADGRPLAIMRQALSVMALHGFDAQPFALRGEIRTPADLESGERPVNPGPEPQPPRGIWGRVTSMGKGVMVRGIEALRQPPAFGAVHIATAPGYDADLLGVLKQQYEAYRPHVPLRGKRVVLKPNLVEYHRDKVINTNPRFVDAVIRLCQEEGAAEVIVGEGPGHWRNVEFLVEASGLGEVLRRRGVRFVDLNHDEPVKTLNLGRTTGLEYLYLTRTVTTADVFISLPKLKTHHWAAVTLSLKNLFGTLPGICYGWPKNELHWRGIPNSIIDIALTQTPHLAIVDGIEAMEGDGPLNGVARHLGVVVMGADLVAVDATCTRLIGLDPARVPTLVLGAMKKLGRLSEQEIPQVGAAIAGLAQAFELPPQIEKQLLPTARRA